MKQAEREREREILKEQEKVMQVMHNRAKNSTMIEIERIKEARIKE